MDTKNTIAAISLSAAVIIIWSFFFGPSPEEIKQNKINQEQVKQEQNQKSSDTPSLDQNENFSKLSREEALNENNRIRFENENIIGSINMQGALIDDLTFKHYNVELNGNQKVVLLKPRIFDVLFRLILKLVPAKAHEPRGFSSILFLASSTPPVRRCYWVEIIIWLYKFFLPLNILHPE